MQRISQSLTGNHALSWLLKMPSLSTNQRSVILPFIDKRNKQVCGLNWLLTYDVLPYYLPETVLVHLQKDGRKKSDPRFHWWGVCYFFTIHKMMCLNSKALREMACKILELDIR